MDENKPLRINEAYGKWTYRKEVDIEDPKNYVYYLSGTDAKGKEWSFLLVSYAECLAIAKADEETKEAMQNF